MVESISSVSNITEKTSLTKINYALDKGSSSAILKSAESGKSGVVNFDWLNIDKKLRESLSNDGSLSRILAATKVSCKSPSITEKEREKAIEEEKKHLSKTVTERTTYNTNQLKKAGVKERQIYKYLTYDGHVTFEGKRILKEHGLSYK